MVLDVGEGAQLFNLAVAMSDERFDEEDDPEETFATETQIDNFRRENGMSRSPDDPTLRSMQDRLGHQTRGDMSSLRAMAGTERDSDDEPTNPSGEEQEGRQEPLPVNVRPQRGQGSQLNTERGNSMHWCNVADGIPCDMDMAGCELTGTCDNQVESEHVEVLAAQWLSNDKETRLLQKGLYYTGSGIVAKGTWIATFGILRESTATSQNNRYSLLVRVGESGEIPQGRRQNWSKND